MRGPIPVSPEIRFNQKLNKDGPIPQSRPDLGRCWVWTAGKNKVTGYGIFHPRHATTTTAHRFAYEQHFGPLEPGMVPDHLCRNRACGNWAHLEAVTDAENLRRGRGFRLLNGMDDSCTHGHKYTPENTYVNPNDSTDKRCRSCARIRDEKRAPRGR